VQVDQFAWTSLIQVTPVVDVQQQPKESPLLAKEALEGKRVVAAVYLRPADKAGGKQEQQQQWHVSHWKLTLSSSM
jgi:hypothetical protein